MFETYEDGKNNTTGEKRRLLARQNQGEDQDAIHKAIVLKVDMVDDKKTRGEEDGQTSRMGGLFIWQGNGLDESTDHPWLALTRVGRPL